MITLPKLQKGDAVAILSPASGLAGSFPWVVDQGLERLQSIFGLHPVEFPTTRMTAATPEERAADLTKAFADQSIKAIITTLGGHDQIKVLKHIDTKIVAANPKPFFGFSDNTNIMQLLWKLGIPSYYGGAIMTQFAMQQRMDDLTVEFLHHAFFDKGIYELPTTELFTEMDLDWADKDSLNKKRTTEANEGWHWDGAASGEGLLWGGCVETMVAQLASDIFLPETSSLKDAVLFLETAEGIPEHWIMEYVLIALGERGILQNIQAVLVGRPKTWALDKPLDTQARRAYKVAQRDLVLKTVREYNATVPIVQNMDFGHTDPQIVLPMGNRAFIDSSTKTIRLAY